MEREQLRLQLLKVAADTQRTGDPEAVIAAAEKFEAFVTKEAPAKADKAPKK